MTQSSIQHITLPAGETRELVFINEPNMDWHIVQQADSSLRVHILFLSEDDTAAQWQSQLFVEQNGTNCRTEIYAMGLLHEMITEPQLEIYADDVKASHGATTGQLDESALFYMQQRCIDRDTAAKLLLCAFFDEVLQTLSDTQLQENLIEKINRIL